MIVEVCANSFSSALIAQQVGADRIELCQDLLVGGTTPSAGTILLVKQQLRIPIFVLIRPRSGDFVYSDEEIKVITQDLLFCKENGIEGVVIGLLTEKGEINTQQLASLMDIARPMSVTFHRAFDRTSDPIAALEKLIELGVDRVLTSGQATNALKGKHLLKKLVEQSKGRIEILAGGGINHSNVTEIIRDSKVKEVHLSGKSLIKSPMHGGTSLNATVLPENDYFLSDESKIKAVMQEINGIFEK